MSKDLSEFNIVTAAGFGQDTLHAASFLQQNPDAQLYGFADGKPVTGDVDAVITPTGRVLFVSPSAAQRGFNIEG